MLDAGKPIVILKGAFNERRTANTESRNLGEFSKKKLEIIRLERYIGIQVANNVVAKTRQSCVSSIECQHLTSEMALGALRRPDEFYPRVVSRVFCRNFVSAVR